MGPAPSGGRQEAAAADEPDELEDPEELVFPASWEPDPVEPDPLEEAASLFEGPELPASDVDDTAEPLPAVSFGSLGFESLDVEAGRLSVL